MPEARMPEKEKKKHYVRAAYAPDGPGALSMIELLSEHGIDAFRQGGVKDIYKGTFSAKRSWSPRKIFKKRRNCCRKTRRLPPMFPAGPQ